MWLRITEGPDDGRVVPLEGERFVIGTAEDASLRLTDDQVAPVHASLRTLPEGEVQLHDEGAEGGVFVDGDRVEGSIPISGDETIRVGQTLIHLSLGDPTAADEEAAEEAQVAEAAADPEVAEILEDELGHPPPPEAGAVVPARTRRAYLRGMFVAMRNLRRTARVAMGLAAVSLLAAAVILVLALSGAIGGDDGEAVAEVVRDVAPATVLIRAEYRDEESGGSGWVLDAGRGLVVTNFHVINGGNEFQVGVGDDLRDADLIGAAPCDDLAVLRVDEREGLEDLPLGSQDDVDQGSQVVAIGFPANASLEDEVTSTAGVVSVARSSFRLPVPDSPRFKNLVQTDAALNPGNSGGPLVNRDGELVGVNTAILTEVSGQPIQGQGYAIGVDRVKEVVADLREGRSQGWAGTGFGFLPRRALERRRLPVGVVALGAAPDTSAAEEGVEEVLLTELNGRRLDNTMATYCDAVEDVRSGEVGTFTVIARPGAKPRKVRVKFE